ncbi:hypothetical protein [Alkalicoccus urumqiensis]|uniref:Uncharacterized protein n=1 Tax=Alkalicoccus urumqiensis TaxID=1548213 RepID=A0A2P6MGQ9_ALKUR|nr:hypothetical protein [Alkalicoccus urumqiensis]PRO65461.1 hypothetical protein C6I21_09910 [Alkalicoccus urumqiensis]
MKRMIDTTREAGSLSTVESAVFLLEAMLEAESGESGEEQSVLQKMLEEKALDQEDRILLNEMMDRLKERLAGETVVEEQETDS